MLDNSIKKSIKQSILVDVLSKVIECCKMMNDDYLKKQNQIENNENKIRDILLFDYLQDNYIRKKLDLTEFYFNAEPQEMLNNNVGMLDIKVLINKLSFIDTNAYYIIECKRIDGKRRLNKKYVSDGVERFVSIKNKYYSTYNNTNALLSFVVKEIDIDSNFKNIDSIQNESVNLKSLDEISRENKNIYFSTYDVGIQNIKLYHCFYDFSKIIK